MYVVIVVVVAVVIFVFAIVFPKGENKYAKQKHDGERRKENFVGIASL